METQEITVVEYIKTTLQNDIDYVRREKPYLTFFLIVSGIEFLGKCFNPSRNWRQKGHSQEDFETAICKLDSFEKYRKYTSELKKKANGEWDNPPISLYKSVRCGLLHAMLPGENVQLSNGKENPKESDKKLTISLDSFYEDFKAACDEIIDCEECWKGKDKNAIFLKVYRTIEDGLLKETTGATRERR